MREWPTPGEPAAFNCLACEDLVQVVYEPGGQLVCPACKTVIWMPPLPPWHPDFTDS